MDSRWIWTPALALGVVAAATLSTRLQTPPPPPPPPEPEPIHDVDIVICLDTSGSMNGLLDSAKAKLWDIVDQVAEEDPDAHLRVALVTFGDSAHSSQRQGFVSTRSDLTDDLDTLYGEVFSLGTSGSQEWVGYAVNHAIGNLDWSANPEATRMIFVAGNESAHQGPDSLEAALKRAQERGITVNSLFAGSKEYGERDGWLTIAQLGDGEYSAIDADRGVLQHASPQDMRLQQLNAQLNDTYLPYGTGGSAGAANQRRQDGNARQLGAQSISSRTAAKSTGVYDNRKWDLVDATTKGGLKVDAVPTEALPPAMQGLSKLERKSYVTKTKTRRDEINKEIQTLSTQRDAFLAETTATDEQEGLDDAIKRAVSKKVHRKKKRANVAPASTASGS